MKQSQAKQTATTAASHTSLMMQNLLAETQRELLFQTEQQEARSDAPSEEPQDVESVPEPPRFPTGVPAVPVDSLPRTRPRTAYAPPEPEVKRHLLDETV